MTKARILVVDDELHLRQVMVGLLEQAGYEATAVAGGKEALEEIVAGGVDLLITDLRMPGMDGLALLRELATLAPDVPAIMLSAYGTVASAVEAMKLGAREFITKPFERDEIMAIVARTLDAYGPADAAPPAIGERELAGSSPGIRECRSLIARAAKSKTATVLLRGESGTGKELAALAIHRESGCKGAFIVANCGALPETMIEAELFGYEKGAFTGAIKARPGLAELADGGTLFLDEIAEVPAHIQVKLLRLIAEKTFTRLGGTSSRRVDVRFVAATHQNLEELMAAGKFREDLFYRLDVVGIEMPPLRERPGDVAELSQRFCKALAAEDGKSCRLDDAALAALAAYNWPGNVRQLRNVVERLVVFADRPTIGADEVRRVLERAPQTHLASGASLEDARRDAEHKRVKDALALAKGNVSKAARILEVSRRTMYYKLKEIERRA